MKTREQLIDEVNKKLDSYSPRETVAKIIDLVVEACEEAVKNKKEYPYDYYDPELQSVFSIGRREERKIILENLKKLKSK